MPVEADDLSALLSSAVLILVGQILYSASKLVERILLTRALTPDAYGEVSIAIAVMSIGSTVALLGLSQGVPRFVSRFDDLRDVRGAWVTGLLITGAFGLVLSAALILRSGALAGLLFEGPDSVPLLILFALALPFVIGMRMGVGVIRGMENTRYRTYTRDLLYPGLRLGVLAILLTMGVGVLSIGYAYVLAAFVTFVAVHLLLNRLFPLVGEIRTHTRELLTFSVPLVVSTVLSMLLTQTDTVMLGYFEPSYQVGLYSAAYPLAGALSLILASFGFLYFPMASRLDSEDKRGEMDAIYKLTTKWIFILTFPAFLTLVVFPGDVLSIIFGSEYAPGASVLTILAFGFFTRAAFGRNKETLSAIGYTTYLMFTNGFAFVLNIALNLLLIPRYGITGAAMASALSFVGLNLAVYSFLKFRFGISPFSQSTLRTVIVVPALLFPPTLLAASWGSLNLLSLLVFAALAELATIATVVVTGCLQPEDRMPVEFVEDRLGVQIPLIRRFLPDPP